MNQSQQDSAVENQEPSRRRTDRVATYIGGLFSSCVGVALLVAAIALKIWKTGDFKALMEFGAMTGLCLGYGLGGDIWGARLYDLFSGHNTQRLVKTGKPVSSFIQKATLFGLIGLLFFVLALWVAVLLCMRHAAR